MQNTCKKCKLKYRVAIINFRNDVNAKGKQRKYVIKMNGSSDSF